MRKIILFGGKYMYKGRVTHRVNGAPLVGISVSDGRNVTKTDDDGRFELSGWEKTNFIYLNLCFVCFFWPFFVNSYINT